MTKNTIASPRDESGRFAPTPLCDCPWCGGEVVVVEGEKKLSWGGITGNELFRATCQECGSCGPELGSRKDAATEWNEVAEAAR